ncbi:AraC family transcriptional regulator [Bacillus sp. HMF5848]|uniref:helix-turn-helix domain-containing protein n=1 Tax=Bacillus sp. HMF5848 TaxID=2495421 RepID=UPI000F79D91D|nr:AraC family transcriptional regulator [Bacillus sp. HMF5848]RSK26537.1 AraC family transcriptional regulator [Bacillus sp. HMF5848]
MIKNIKALIDHIDNHYHEVLTRDDVEYITKLSYGHVRNDFRQIVNMPLDKYRKRRQLSLIIEEIAQSGSSINRSNIAPWNSENSFRVAFKNEFNVTPKKVIDGKFQGELQSKFDVDKYTKEYRVVQRLIKTHGSPNNALEFLLTLPPFVVSFFNRLVSYETPEKEYKAIIKNTYGELSKEGYKEKMVILKNYYDINRAFCFKPGAIFSNVFIIAKRDLIKHILTKGDIYLSYSPLDIRTVWNVVPDIKSEREKNYYRKKEEVIISMPNELINKIDSLTFMQQEILRNLIFQDCGALYYETFEDLIDQVKYNYNKPISSRCNKCNCDGVYLEEDCPRIEDMDTEELNEYLSKPRFELLNYENLRKEIDTLLIKGLLYFVN